MNAISLLCYWHWKNCCSDQGESGYLPTHIQYIYCVFTVNKKPPDREEGSSTKKAEKINYFCFLCICLKRKKTHWAPLELLSLSVWFCFDILWCNHQCSCNLFKKNYFNPVWRAVKIPRPHRNSHSFCDSSPYPLL